MARQVRRGVGGLLNDERVIPLTTIAIALGELVKELGGGKRGHRG